MGSRRGDFGLFDRVRRLRDQVVVVLKQFVLACACRGLDSVLHAARLYFLAGNLRRKLVLRLRLRLVAQLSEVDTVWQKLRCKQHFVDDLIQRASIEKLVVNLAIFSWEDSYEFTPAVVFGHRLRNDVSEFHHACLSQKHVQVAVLFRVLLPQAINEIFNLRVVNEILDPHIVVTSLRQGNTACHLCVSTVQFGLADSICLALA